MPGFISTYKEDYLWPQRKPYFPRANLTCVVAGPIYDESDESSRVPPNVKLGPCPIPEKFENDPTDVCLKQLLDDKPNLLDVKPKKPCATTIKKFNLERLLSTYQVDFDHKRDRILPKTEIQIESKQPDCTTETKPFDCRPSMSGRAELMRRKKKAKDPCAEKTACTLPAPRIRKPKEIPLYKQRQIPSWTSEYREEFNKTGLEYAKELGMSRRMRKMIRLNKLLKPRLICNNDAVPKQ